MKRIDQSMCDHGPANPANFAGAATMQRLLGRGDGEPVRLYRVTFARGGRTNWHTHDGAQLLFGLSGRCVVVDRSGTTLTLDPGDVVVIDPHEEHWHGAAPGGGGEHLAINVGKETVWLDSSEHGEPLDH